MEFNVNFYKPDLQPENIIYFSKIRFKSYKDRLFKICNIALGTVIKYQMFFENYQSVQKQKYYNEWKAFLQEYYHCTLNSFNAKDKKTNLLGYCYWSKSRDFYPEIHLRYFTKSYEDVFWHELAHLILHTKSEIDQYISYDLKEFEAEFFAYCIDFYAKDIGNKNQFNLLLSQLNNISKKELRNYNIYHNFLKEYGVNNRNSHFGHFGSTTDLVEQMFYNCDYINKS